MIATIVGTNRPGSNSRRIGDELGRIYSRLGAETSLLDLAELRVEIFLPIAYAQKPPAFEPFARRVLEASGLAIIAAEYNGSFPGVLKVFIDHLPFPQSFEQKPVCFIGLSGGVWGGLRAVEHLQGIFGHRNAHVFPERVFIPRSGSAFNEQGLLQDPKTWHAWSSKLRAFLISWLESHIELEVL